LVPYKEAFFHILMGKTKYNVKIALSLYTIDREVEKNEACG
jgi:hypothetical protein